MNNTVKYRSISASVLLAFVVNLFLPAALGATQLFCKDAPFVHAERMHAACCIKAGSTPDISHSSCSWGQICDQALENGLNKTAVFPTHHHSLTGTPVVYTVPFNPGPNTAGTATKTDASLLSVRENIYILHGALLN